MPRHAPRHDLVLPPALLLSAYAEGVFPMALDDGNIYWFDPDPRAIIPLDALHVPRRLARTIKAQPYEIRINSAFAAVIRACAAPAHGRGGTWIDDRIRRAYIRLHEAGYAHSVEAWQDGQLVGGLYGVALNGLFAGESMFARARDASKICLYHLVERLRARGFTLLDTQYQTEHLRRFGTIEIPRSEYRARLRAALQLTARFAD